MLIISGIQEVPEPRSTGAKSKGWRETVMTILVKNILLMNMLVKSAS